MALKPIGVVITKAAPFIRFDAAGWAHHAYRVTVSYQGRRTWHIFRTGMGWDTDPTRQDVLENMVDDYYPLDQIDAEDFGAEPGSPEARRVEKALTAHHYTMHRVFGEDLDEFLETYQEK